MIKISNSRIDASMKDNTFDKTLGANGGHKCCGSKAPWRHKTSCKNSISNYNDDLSDLKDIC